MRYLMLTLIAGFLHNYSFSQVDSIVSKARQNSGFEEVFVHTNKGSYVAGETIWFKAYFFDGMYPSTQSTALKMQLIADDKTVIAEGIYPVVSGITAANIQLPLQIKTGRYFLKAEGNNAELKNAPSQAYIVPLIINNPSLNKAVEPVAYIQHPTIKFSSPNGLLAGTVNQAYVSITDQYKQPIQATGAVIDSENDTISAFTTNELGLAEIRFLPDEDEQYVIKLNNDTSKRYPIITPIVKSGITMVVNYKDAAYNIALNATPDFIKDDYTLLIEYNYNVAGKAPVHFDNNSAIVNLAASQLPAGISRVVLLSKDNKAICGRFVFSANTSAILNTSGIAISLNNVDTVASRIALAATDTTENTISISATDAGYNFGSMYKTDNIINRFLLTGYFNEAAPAYNGLIEDLPQADVPMINEALAANDLQIPAWAKVNEMASTPPIESKTDNSYIGLTGTVYKKDKVVASQPISVMLTGQGAQSASMVLLDANGKFKINNLIFSDTVTMRYKLTDKSSAQQIKLDLDVAGPKSYFPGSSGNMSFMDYYTPMQLTDIVQNSTINSEIKKQTELYKLATDTTIHELPHVTVQATKNDREKMKEVDKRYATDLFARDPSYDFNFIVEPNYTGRISVLQYLQYYGRQMTVSGSGTNARILKYTGWKNPQIYSIFVDQGHALAYDLDNIFIDDVALIKVYTTSFVMAESNGPAIAVFTRKPQDYVVAPDDSTFKRVKIAGYSPVKDFINPDEDNAHKINRQLLAGTFYWNPYLSLGSTAKPEEIKLYNLNKVKTAEFVLQGMSSDGHLIYFKQPVESKQQP